MARNERSGRCLFCRTRSPSWQAVIIALAIALAVVIAIKGVIPYIA